MTHAATKKSPALQLESPRFENGKALLIAGLRTDYTPESINDLPSQWQRFVPHIGKIPGQIGRVTYGVCWCPDNAESIGYLCGVEVSNFSSLPGEFTIVSIPAQRYAVFSHHGHVSTIRETIEAIGSQWLPQSGHETAATDETPAFFERYTEEFDPRTGMGGMEIWIPVWS
ncbi:MAG TPA: GyrI-like domain-containing protein [Candidatus Dormibacteraeota bacterium]|nr:GyrI-like domain-containing protein [Candidatus Dormibacteraeota bacterium]